MYVKKKNFVQSLMPYPPTYLKSLQGRFAPMDQLPRTCQADENIDSGA